MHCLIKIIVSLQGGASRRYPPAWISSAGPPTLISGSNWSTTTIATWSTLLSGQAYGNGLYRITSASGNLYQSTMVYPQFAVFDSDTQYPGPHWKDNNYVNGVWNGGTAAMFTLDSSYYGDWVHIQLPEAIVVTSCTFTARNDIVYRAPTKFRIYGSNNGSSWTVIHDQTSPLTYTSAKATVTVQGTSAYSYIALVVSALAASGDALNFFNWGIFGKVCLLVSTSLKVCDSLRNISFSMV
jgi:hypothetical protein